MKITSTEAQNNFGKYLKLVNYEEIIITKNGKEVALLAPYSDITYDNKIMEKSPLLNYGEMNISYDEYESISKKSDNRYEYIDGVLYLMDSPLYPHQKALREISYIFTTYFRNKKCEPLTSPFDVTLFKQDDINVVQPDILVMCDKDKIDENGKYEGIPSLIVEILSKSTKSKDMIKKLDLYMKSGVKEYWIVNTDSEEVYIYSFKNCDLENLKTYKRGEEINSTIFNGLKMDTDTIFK